MSFLTLILFSFKLINGSQNSKKLFVLSGFELITSRFVMLKKLKH